MGVCRICCKGGQILFLGGGWACDALRSHALIRGVRGARRGGGARVGRRLLPLREKKVFWLYCGPFCYVFLILEAFSPCGDLFATFYFMVQAFLGLPPPPTKISAGAHDCKEGSKACSPEIFLCDRNLVSFGHVLLRFCLKNDKNNDKL